MLDPSVAPNDSLNLPLTGYRVLNLASERGAICGKVLADLGADVIKVEPLEGDSARNVGPFCHKAPHLERSLFWFAYYTNQRSITLDINSLEGRKIFMKLVEKSDFLIESFSPGYLKSVGLDFTELSKINPSLIMTSISPFGQEGPYKDWNGSDIVVAAMGMIMSLLGDPDRPPLRVGGVEQSYLVAGAYAAAGTMIAHYHRLLTGQGQYVDVSAQESVLLTTLGLYQFQEMEGYSLRRSGNHLPRWGKEERQIWPCRDGYILWIPFLGAQGRRTRYFVDWMTSEGKAEDLGEVRWEEIGYEDVDPQEFKRWQEIFARFIKGHTKAEFEKEAIKRGLTLIPASNPEELLANAQLKARNYWVNVSYPELEATITHPGASYKSTGLVERTPHRAPLLGEHNLEIYHGMLGLSLEEMTILKQINVI